MAYSFKELSENYNIDLDEIIKSIRDNNFKSVLLQFPEGLKPYAVLIVDFLKDKTSVDISIWLGSCFGACDIPNTKCDLLVQFGHSPWS